MSIKWEWYQTQRNLILGLVSITKSERHYYKTRQLFYYKMRQFITKCIDLITECDSYYKMRRLLQISSVQTLRNRTSDI